MAILSLAWVESGHFVKHRRLWNFCFKFRFKLDTGRSLCILREEKQRGLDSGRPLLFAPRVRFKLIFLGVAPGMPRLPPCPAQERFLTAPISGFPLYPTTHPVP